MRSLGLSQPRPERVALVAACRFPAPRGSQVLIDEMARAFEQSGVETHLVAPLTHGFRRTYRAHAVAPRSGIAPPADPMSWPRLARLLLDGALAARLDAIVRRERPAVLHAHNYEGLAAALLVRRLRRVPVVFHSHAMLADELPLYARDSAAAQRSARRLGSWCDRTLPRLADHVVALSPDVAEYLRAHGVRPERVSVIPPGLDPAPFARAMSAGRRPARAIFTGNLDGYQNLGLLLDAWAEARVPAGAELSVVTHAAPHALGAEIARRHLGRSVRLVCARSIRDVAGELAGASVGLSPRRSWSGFPMKTLNYMASGLPTIALAPSAKGVRDGETGWVVKESRPAALADALGTALGDLDVCAQRGRLAREALADQHAWVRIAPALLEVSRRVADRDA